MAATGPVPGRRAKSFRFRRRARRPLIPAADHSFIFQINIVRIYRIPGHSQMIQIEQAINRRRTSMALQDRLDAFKADFESGRFPLKPTREALETMHRATAELIASEQVQRARKAGDTAPDFTLADSNGKPVSSRELLSKGPLVVSFYRGVWCPYCNLELQALQQALS